MIEREVLHNVSLDAVKLNPDNPRINDEAVNSVIKSIKASEYISPIIIDEDHKILAGNTRYKALVKMEAKDIPIVIRVKGLTADQKERFILADNKTTEMSGWDWTKLGTYTEEMLKDVGFDADELDRILDVRVDMGEADDVPIMRQVPIVKGDLFLMGDHKLLCGNATVVTDIERLMGKDRGTLMFTSPPYWVGKEYEKQKSVAEIGKFIRDVAACMIMAMSKDESRIIINTGTGFTTAIDKKMKRHTLLLIDKWTNELYDLGWNLRHVRHWIKRGGMMSINKKTDMIDQHCEFIGTYEADDGKPMKWEDKINQEDVNVLATFYAREGKLLIGHTTGEKWALQGYWDDITGTAKEAGHVAGFPVELVDRHLLLYTGRGQLVVDVFGGSGTTMIACERLKRKCNMLELDTQYCGLILDRWSKFTGKDPIRVNDEKSWSEIAPMVKGGGN